MEADAEAYNVLSKPQYKYGCEFVHALKISPGNKILDMGCGTGDLTNLIASLVGPHGDVVGVDPDEARVKIAQEKFKDVKNLHFIVGDSSSRLPHDEHEYYDLHFSSNAFHWCIGNQKKVYLEKAYQCLKPGGRLAFLTGVTNDLMPCCEQDFRVECLSGAEYKRLCKDALFQNILTETLPTSTRFSNFEIFKDWFRASCHRDLTDFDPDWLKSFLEKAIKTEPNGSVVMKLHGLFRLIAEKKGRSLN